MNSEIKSKEPIAVLNNEARVGPTLPTESRGGVMHRELVTDQRQTSILKNQARIGPTLPAENREWLKYHEIVTDKRPSSVSQKKARIGPTLPAENREKVKHREVVTDQRPSKVTEPHASLPKKKIFDYEKIGFVFTLFLVSIFSLVWFQQRQGLLNEIKAERSRFQSMENSNYHLRGSFAALASMKLMQQSEINRLASQIRGMMGQFNLKVSGFKKGEAMFDALQRTYDMELAQISRQYDIEALKKQVHVKDQMISSLESSLNSIDGVVVRADSMVGPSGVNSALVVSVNVDFQLLLLMQEISKA